MKKINYHLKLVLSVFFFLLLISCDDDEVIVQKEAKRFKLVYPQGGEYFNTNDTIPIIWENNTAEFVKIEFSSNLGYDWLTIADSLANNIKIYFWKTPDLISSNCIVKISTISAIDSLSLPFSINIPEYKRRYLNYYPLGIGNQWVYKSIYPGSGETFHYSTIISDTIINQKIYFIIKNKIQDLYYYNYETIDTLTGNIIRFEFNQERVIDNLYAKVGEKIACLRFTGSLDSTLFESENNVNLWGTSRNLRTYFNDGFPDRWRYSLVNGIGLFAYRKHIHPLGIATDTLLACSINEIIYGDSTLIR